MSIQKQLKVKVTKDWLQAFPELVAYGANRFYKISGPMIWGIDLIKLPRGEAYRPYFTIYPLWEENIKMSMDHSYKLIALKNKKGLQFNISYDKHDEYIEEAIGCMRDQIYIHFEGDISLNNIFQTIEYNLLSTQVNEIISAYLLKLNLLFYFQKYEELNSILFTIKKDEKILNTHYFQCFLGSFDTWFSNLKESFSMNRRESFLNQIKTNKKEKKVQEMIVSKIII